MVVDFELQAHAREVVNSDRLAVPDRIQVVVDDVRLEIVHGLALAIGEVDLGKRVGLANGIQVLSSENSEQED